MGGVGSWLRINTAAAAVCRAGRAWVVPALPAAFWAQDGAIHQAGQTDRQDPSHPETREWDPLHSAGLQVGSEQGRSTKIHSREAE